MTASWRSNLPPSWRLGRLNQVATAWTSNVDKHTVVGEVSVRLCNYTDVYKNDFIDGDMDFMTATATPEQVERCRLTAGDTVITKDSETANDIGIPAFVRYQAADFVCGYHLAIVRPSSAVVPRFLYWVMASQPILHQWAVCASGVTRVGIRSTDLTKAAVPVPPINEQRTIADYLDRETARIDTLIEEQQRLIDLLHERRRDLIRDAVLGAVNPFSPPADVAFTAIGHHFSVALGKMLDAGKATRDGDQLLPYIRAGNIQDAGLQLDNVNEMPYSAAEAASLNLLRGDLLVVEGGAVGTNALVHEDMPGWSFQKTVNRLRPLNNWSSAWLGYVLRTYRDIGVIDIVCNKSTIPHLTAEKLRAIRIPSVDPQNQMRVVKVLEQQTAKIDTLITETERFIELSKERRSALITAAVTGQIDVREAA